MAREPHRSSEILDAVALLVVDMQDAFLNVMPDREAVLRRTALAIEAARAFGIKVVFTEQVPAKLGPTNAELLALAPEARVFAKNEFSALLAEGLQDYLRRINVYHLLLAGLETPICIYQTALHAQDNELDVTLLSDCTTGRRAEDSLVVLEALARAECHVLPAETVFYSMLGSCLNPRFAHFTRIVKRYSGEGPIDGTPTPAPEAESRPEGDERRGGQRHGERQGGGRQGDSHDRQRGGRRGDRQPARAEHAETQAEEPTDDLRAEDGISDDEANQPSYEEATAGHSDHERAPEDTDSPAADSDADDESPASEGSERDENGDDSDADDESTAGDRSGEQGEGAPPKKRGRRRRGGARRRRARERAAAGGSAEQPAVEGGGAQESSAPSDGPAPAAPAAE